MADISITTTHQLGKELLSKQDDYITITIGDREYSIDHIKRIRTHANKDDGVMHLTLVCDKLYGNIVR